MLKELLYSFKTIGRSIFTCLSIPIFILFFPSDLLSQLSFNTLDVAQGLSQNSVVSIAQDSTGYLWFCTQDGLNRYHGEFTIFDEQYDDITRNDYKALGKIYVDKKGKIWTIVKGGILKFYDAPQQAFIIEENLQNVSLILQDVNLNYWYTTSEGQVIRLDPNWEVQDTLLSNGNYDFFDIQLVNDNIVIASSDGVLKFGLDGKPKDHVLKNKSISSISFNEEKTIYTTFLNGIFIENRQEEITKLEIEELNNFNFYEVKIDAKNRIWLGTYGAGLFVIDQANEVKHYLPIREDDSSINYHDILEIYEDETGVIWLGTDGGGISYFDEHLQKFKSKTVHTVPSDVKIEVIRSIYVNNDIVFLGTSGHGLTIYNKKTDRWKTLNVEDGLSSNRIMAIQQSEDGRLVLGSQFNGLSIVRFDKDYNIITNDYFLEDQTVWCLSRETDTSFWVGTATGSLYLIDVEKGVLLKKELLSDDGEWVSIRSIEKIDSSRVAIGTDANGLFVYDRDKDDLSNITNDNRLNKIKHLSMSNDRLLVATNGSGLMVLNTRDFNVLTSATKKNGLANNVIYGVYSTDDDIWFSSNRGIGQLGYEQDSLFLKRNYQLKDGLQSYEYNTGAYFKTKEGEIYFGGILGFNWFNPEKIKYNLTPPKPIIQRIQILDTIYQSSRKTIKIKPDENVFSFHMMSNQLSAPNQNLYKYRLLEFQSNWKYSTTSEIAFMNIEPGTYDFEVAVANYDGKWSNETATQKIIIGQVWYLTWWFKSLFIGLISFLLYRLWYSDRMRIKLKSESVQHELKEKYLESLNETRTNFFTNITHELLTPLTVIKGLSSKIEGNDNIKNIINKNSRVLIDLVSQALSISKLKSGYLKNEPFLSDIIAFTKYVTDSYSSMAHEKDIALNFYSEIDILEMDFDQNKLKTVLGNLIVNAIKYTPEYGKVMVVSKKEGDNMLLSVIDNGMGMDEETQAKIFDRFYQAGKKDHGGVGIGLSIVKEYCKVMEIGLSVKSKQEAGSQFDLLIGITKEAKPYVLRSDEQPKKSDLSSSLSALGNNDFNILVVEDNVDVANYIINVISNSFNCVHYKNGKDALKYAQQNIPDLVITDIMMPIMDGITFTKLLKEEVSTSHIPVIMLTAKISEIDKMVGLKSGADAYLAKPFNEEELLIRIKNIFESRAALQKRFDANVQATSAIAPVRKDAFLEKVLDFIEANISNENLSVTDICAVVNLERTQLYRKLKAMTGKSASEIIIDVRLQKAYKLISENDTPLSQIAFDLGYKELSYFSKSFKKKFGIPPSSLRE